MNSEFDLTQIELIRITKYLTYQYKEYQRLLQLLDKYDDAVEYEKIRNELKIIESIKSKLNSKTKEYFKSW